VNTKILNKRNVYEYYYKCTCMIYLMKVLEVEQYFELYQKLTKSGYKRG